MPQVQTSQPFTISCRTFPARITPRKPGDSAFQHSNIPTFQLSNFPTFQLSNFPTFQLSNFPTFQHSNIPTFQLSNFPTIKIAAEKTSSNGIAT
ncbi:hypothetical protein [Raoultella terrigena]|uniref:hypothetical protein n=1 Tax=Raoultella terrigena TaxID=577 RepID=UPI00349FBD05